MPSEDRWCETCRWWGAERAHDYDRPWGRCRRVPPIFTVPGGLTSRDINTGEPSQPIMVSRGEWPWVAFDDWCGGYELAQAEKADAHP